VALVAGCCAAVLIAGCSSGQSPSAVSAAGGATLQADVLALTRAAAAHDWSAADGALSELRSDLAQALAAGSVDAARGKQIQATIAAITADLAAQRGTATSSTPPSSSASKAATTSATTTRPTPRRTTSTAPKPPAPKPPAPKPTPTKRHGKKGKD
jgi:hypothetical protein